MWWTVWWIPFILTAPLMLGLLVEAIGVRVTLASHGSQWAWAMG